MLLTSRSEPWARAPAPSGPACLSRADFEMPENGGTSVGVLSGMNELRRSMISSTCSRLRCCKMLYCTRVYCSSMIYSACRPPARLGAERNLLRGLTCAASRAARTSLSRTNTHFHRHADILHRRARNAQVAQTDLQRKLGAKRRLQLGDERRSLLLQPLMFIDFALEGLGLR